MIDQNFRTTIADYIREQAQPPDKYSHQPRLYRLAVSLGAGLAYDDDVLYAAAWLHDLGVFIGHRPADPEALANWDNIAYAMGIVPGLLTQWGFPEAKIRAVVAAISTHLPSQQPTTVEGTLLRDADILEQLGAIGLLRTVSKIGRDTRYTTFADALQHLQRCLDTLPQQLHLPAARKLAEPRIRALNAILAAAYAEADGEL
jgi:uncharacterized protein